MAGNELTNVPKLNFFQNIRKRFLLLRIDVTRYNNAPDYLKNDISVINALLNKSEYNVAILSDENLYRVLEERPDLIRKLDNNRTDETIKRMPKLIVHLDENNKSRQLFDLKRYELFRELSKEEQVQLLTSETEYRYSNDKKKIMGYEKYINYSSDKISSRGESGKFKIDPMFFGDKLNNFSEEAVLQAITVLKEKSKEKDEHRINNRAEEILKNLEIDKLPVESQLKIVNLDSRFVKKMSKEAAIKFVDKNPLLLNMVDSEVAKTIIRENPELIATLDRKTQKKVVEEDRNPEYLKYIPGKYRFSIEEEAHKKTLITDPEEAKRAIVSTENLSLFYLSEATDFIQDREILTDISKIAPQILGISHSFDDLKIANKIEKVKELYKSQIQDPDILEAIVKSFYMSNEIKNNIEDRQKNVAIHKILTNDMVMKTVDPQKIAQFIMDPTMEQLTEFVGIAYGEEAKAILESRPELEFKHIPNLYIFDPKIREEFGEGMVHNMLSYEGKAPVVLADLVVNPGKMEQFKKFDRITNGFFQDNVAGIEDKFVTFKNYEDLIYQIDENDLDENRMHNLRLLLVDRNNPETHCISVDTIEDLDNYENERNKIYDDAISKLSDPKEIQDLISRRFFGMPLENEFDENYRLSKLSLKAMLEYYNIDSFINDERTQESEMFSEDELDQLEIASIISKVNDPDVLKDIYKALSEKEKVLGPVEFESIKQKIPEQYSKELLSSLLTVENARNMAQNGDPGISIETTEDGIEIINLHGADFKMIIHTFMIGGQTNSGLSIPADVKKDELWKYFESGMSTISTCLIEPNLLDSCGNNSNDINFGFSSSVDPRQIIGMSHQDAHVSHQKRNIDPDFEYRSIRFNYPEELIRKTAAQITGIERKDITHPYNEIAMYRREQELNKVNNENFGGKIMPDYIVVYGKASDKHKELAKKFMKDGKPLPIIEIDTEVYDKYPFNIYNRAQKKEDHSREREGTENITQIKDIAKGENNDGR